MKEQIHELRTRIDELAQLVKSLDKPLFIIPESCIPTDMTMEDMIRDIKSGCDAIHKDIITEPIQIGPSFLFESYKSLLLAKAWLGKVLAELGEETPYKNDGNRKTVEDIEPTADVSSGQGLFKDDFELLWWKNELTYIEKINWIREEISKITGFDPKGMSYVGIEASRMTVRQLVEACFHLGFELSLLKDQAK